MTQLDLIQSHESVSDRQAWATPWKVFRTLHAEYHFTVDACASPHNAKMARHWTKSDDGLIHKWECERVFCNPPFEDIDPWLYKGTEAELAVFLVPSRTGRPWWKWAVDNHAETHIFVGRVEYIPDKGVQESSVSFFSSLLVFKKGAKESRKMFFRDAVSGMMLP